MGEKLTDTVSAKDSEVTIPKRLFEIEKRDIL